MAIPTEPTLSTGMRVLKRSAGRNACQYSAYISGSEITDAKTGELHDYSNRLGVEMAELMTPEGAPEWATHRETLWNKVEETERRKDSQLARELRFGFSYDLTAEQRAELAREVGAHFTAQGMCADVAVHRYSHGWAVDDPMTAEQLGKWQAWGIPFVDAERSASLNSEHVMVTLGKDGQPADYRLLQPHCHVFLTMRPIADHGLGFEGKTDTKESYVEDGKVKKRAIAQSKARDWNEWFTEDKGLGKLRATISERQNAALENNGSPRRIDARGYEVRRTEALSLAAKAKASGHEAEAVRQTARAAMLNRKPEPYLGIAMRVKELKGRIAERFSQWVAVRHHNRLQPQIDALWQRDPVDFVTKAYQLLEIAGRNLGLSAGRGHSLAMDEPEAELE